MPQNPKGIYIENPTGYHTDNWSQMTLKQRSFGNKRVRHIKKEEYMKGIGYAGAILLFSLSAVAHLEAQTQISTDIVYISPVPGSTMNMPQSSIAIRTKDEVDPGSLAAGGIISVTAASSGEHAGRTVLSDDTRTILFVPNVPFTEGEEVTVNLGNGLRMVDGSSVSSMKFHFTITQKLLKIPPPRITTEALIPYLPHTSARLLPFSV